MSHPLYSDSSSSAASSPKRRDADSDDDDATPVRASPIAVQQAPPGRRNDDSRGSLDEEDPTRIENRSAEGTDDNGGPSPAEQDGRRVLGNRGPPPPLPH